ncbi:MAG TPA: OsmC family peroxiredoxin, partial [Candidatus Binatia bacterium]|nr:OsmC family peroxiredoxin [Candidatus Binatia bacterium]
MTERTSCQLNDVNLEAIGALIEKIRREPGAAKTRWKADVRWTGAFRSEARSRDLGPSLSDEPSALGGSNTAPNPVEQLLAALGNCLAVGYAAN